MSFTFSFDSDDCLDKSDQLGPEQRAPLNKENKRQQSEDEEFLQPKPAEEIIVDWNKLREDSPVTELVPVTDGLALRVVSSLSVEAALKRKSPEKTRDLSQAITAHSDLLPRVYEGGLKIWECSVDLTQYLTALKIAFRGTKVLELGCGAGLPGLYAYRQGAVVTFQDFNEEVLELITAPNVLLSHIDEDHGARCEDSGAPCGESGAPYGCHFIAGDWAEVQHHLLAKTEKFDYILTSETIYSPESYRKLHNILRALLQPHGKIFLAAKTYYFGVGGGTRDFEDLLDAEGVFSHSVCKEYTTGVQREILELTFKDEET